MLTRRGVPVEEAGSSYLADGDADSDDARTLRPLQAAACTYRIAFGPRAGLQGLHGARCDAARRRARAQAWAGRRSSRFLWRQAENSLCSVRCARSGAWVRGGLDATKGYCGAVRGLILYKTKGYPFRSTALVHCVIEKVPADCAVTGRRTST